MGVLPLAVDVVTEPFGQGKRWLSLLSAGWEVAALC